MKSFLFDENVPMPLRFVPSLPVIHATSLGSSSSDQELWTYAVQQRGRSDRPAGATCRELIDTALPAK